MKKYLALLMGLGMVLSHGPLAAMEKLDGIRRSEYECRETRMLVLPVFHAKNEQENEEAVKKIEAFLHVIQEHTETNGTIQIIFENGEKLDRYCIDGTNDDDVEMIVERLNEQLVIFQNGVNTQKSYKGDTWVNSTYETVGGADGALVLISTIGGSLVCCCYWGFGLTDLWQAIAFNAKLLFKGGTSLGVGVGLGLLVEKILRKLNLEPKSVAVNFYRRNVQKKQKMFKRALRNTKSKEE